MLKEKYLKIDNKNIHTYIATLNGDVRHYFSHGGNKMERVMAVGERIEDSTGYKYGNLNISSRTKICFSHGIINKQNKKLFPSNAIDVESYLEIDAVDCSDSQISVDIKFVPMNDDGEMTKHARVFHLGLVAPAVLERQSQSPRQFLLSISTQTKMAFSFP